MYHTHTHQIAAHRETVTVTESYTLLIVDSDGFTFHVEYCVGHCEINGTVYFTRNARGGFINTFPTIEDMRADYRARKAG